MSYSKQDLYDFHHQEMLQAKEEADLLLGELQIVKDLMDNLEYTEDQAEMLVGYASKVADTQKSLISKAYYHKNLAEYFAGAKLSEERAEAVIH